MTVQSDRAAVVGVDFGTLSGRAVVVRVPDGSELGSAVHEYRQGVVDQKLPTSGARPPADRALQVPNDYRDVLRDAVPAGNEVMHRLREMRRQAHAGGSGAAAGDADDEVDATAREEVPT